MSVEIERKFLVDVNKFANETKILSSQHLQQGYLSHTPQVRIRIVNNSCAWLTIKGKGTLSRAEFEYEINAQEAQEMLDFLCKEKITKNRFTINHKNRTWTVDRFFGELNGLWIAEIELNSENEEFEKPSWILEEVTEDIRYQNINLAKNGVPKND